MGRGGGELDSYAQPILLTLLTLAVPATARYLFFRIAAKLDEGRELAEKRAQGVEKLLNDYQAQAESVAAHRHRDNIDRFDRIEVQTTTTNGKVAELDRRTTVVEAQNEMLIKLFPTNGAK